MLERVDWSIFNQSQLPNLKTINNNSDHLYFLVFYTFYVHRNQPTHKIQPRYKLADHHRRELLSCCFTDRHQNQKKKQNRMMKGSKYSMRCIQVIKLRNTKEAWTILKPVSHHSWCPVSTWLTLSWVLKRNSATFSSTEWHIEKALHLKTLRKLTLKSSLYRK